MHRKRKLARGVAVIGAGMSKFAVYKDKDSKDLFVDAFKEMLSSVDKGADPQDIDAIYIGNLSNDFFVHQAHWGPIISDLIGTHQSQRPGQRVPALRALLPSEKGFSP